jgi:imidazole glycerol-phosphate synthase subunit HisF
MKRVRVIPVLLLQKGGLVKTIQFKNASYVGDPINAVKIFNEKEIDEIVILDINATKDKRPPDFSRLKDIAGEAFIPLSYGGGITTLAEISNLFFLGVEKVVMNFSAVNDLGIVTAAAKLVGSQSVVVSIDVKQNIFGKYKVYSKNGQSNTGEDPLVFAKRMESAGAGEIFLNSIDQDGTYKGFDLKLIKYVSDGLSIPLIACGGAATTNDFAKAIQNGASAVAAGSLFVFQGPHRAVLINYPSQKELTEKLYSVI